MSDATQLISKIKSYNSYVDEGVIKNAYKYAADAHKLQRRHSGDPYISHPLDTIKTCIQTNRNYDYFKAKEYMRGGHLRAGMSMINIFISLYVFERMKNL